jgi:cell fate (sporulation/competence/biofilm development) regulator YlbF (YheA/YmcA/DUF963 family)
LFKWALLSGNVGQGTDGLEQTQLQVIEVLCEESSGTKAPPVAGCTKALRTIFLHYESNELVSALMVHRTHLQMLLSTAVKTVSDVVSE